MKKILFIANICSSMLVFGQNVNNDLEFSVLKETLPQLLDQNPNSAASYLRGGEMYEMLMRPFRNKSEDTISKYYQMAIELNNFSDSLANVMTNQKIVVLLIDSLFAYKYKPYITYYSDGYSDLMDLRIPETWESMKENLTELFQIDYEHRGLKKPVDLEFIDLINDQINLNDNDKKIVLSDLNNSHYEYRSLLDQASDSLGDLRINAVRLYKPIFNAKMDKACYLFSYQARNGPSREFVFVEKIEDRWVYVESYGSHHVDFDQN